MITLLDNSSAWSEMVATINELIVHVNDQSRNPKHKSNREIVYNALTEFALVAEKTYEEEHPLQAALNREFACYIREYRDLKFGIE